MNTLIEKLKAATGPDRASLFYLWISGLIIGALISMLLHEIDQGKFWDATFSALLIALNVYASVTSLSALLNAIQGEQTPSTLKTQEAE